jgi:hypothetical protein
LYLYAVRLSPAAAGEVVVLVFSMGGMDGWVDGYTHFCRIVGEFGLRGSCGEGEFGMAEGEMKMCVEE